MKPNYRFSMTDEPFAYIPGGASSGFLFVCDHASRDLPEEYGDLGLSADLFSTHIASDLGAAQVTKALARRFGAPAVLARWSRLLIDLNGARTIPRW